MSSQKFKARWLIFYYINLEKFVNLGKIVNFSKLFLEYKNSNVDCVIYDIEVGKSVIKLDIMHVLFCLFVLIWASTPVIL